jgi:hypothetical protein
VIPPASGGRSTIAAISLRRPHQPPVKPPLGTSDLGFAELGPERNGIFLT